MNDREDEADKLQDAYDALKIAADADAFADRLSKHFGRWYGYYDQPLDAAMKDLRHLAERIRAWVPDEEKLSTAHTSKKGSSKKR